MDGVGFGLRAIAAGCSFSKVGKPFWNEYLGQRTVVCLWGA
ncbi:hypothetical protein [Nostoc sp. FACHB-152]|nr:hypothetical protein [Nostoc sp. FACHB-152]